MYVAGARRQVRHACQTALPAALCEPVRQAASGAEERGGRRAVEVYYVQRYRSGVFSVAARQ